MVKKITGNVVKEDGTVTENTEVYAVPRKLIWIMITALIGGLAGFAGLFWKQTVSVQVQQYEQEQNKKWKEEINQELKDMQMELKIAASDRVTGAEGQTLRERIRENERELDRRKNILHGLEVKVAAQSLKVEELSKRVRELEQGD